MGDRIGRTIICTLDLNGRLKYYNRTVEALLATDESRLLGTTLGLSTAEWQCSGQWRRPCRSACAGRAIANVSPWNWAGLFQCLHDPRKERERDRRRQPDRFLMDDDKRELTLDLVLDVLQDHDLLVMVYYSRGEIISTNSPFQRFLEVDRDTLEGKDLSFVLHGGEEGSKMVAKALIQPDLPSYVTLSMKVQGRAGQVDWSLHPFLRDGKDLVLAWRTRRCCAAWVRERGADVPGRIVHRPDLGGDPKRGAAGRAGQSPEEGGLDFAVIRLLGWDGRPQLFCSGIDFKQAGSCSRRR